MSTVSDALSFDEATNTLNVDHVEGVRYLINGKEVNGEVKLTKNTTVRARPEPGFVFARGTQRDYKFEVNKDLVQREREEARDAAGAQRTAARQDTSPADPVVTRAQPAGTRGGGTTPSPGTSATSAGAEGAGGGTTP
jgi:hypothetical protein